GSSRAGMSGTTFVPVGISLGFRPPAAYTTSIGFKFKPVSSQQLESDLRSVIARSTELAANRNIEVLLDGQTVVLKGTVADLDERRLAENLLRLTPGVHAVRNELVVQP